MAYSKYVLIFLLIFAGSMHFLKPYFFIKIMPSYVPLHLQMVFISGAVEILCGLLLSFPQTQTLGVYLSIFLFIAVFPANIEMAKDYYIMHNKYLWLAILRLPLQFGLIFWVYQFRK